jgi:hypothetical protein
LFSLSHRTGRHVCHRGRGCGGQSGSASGSSPEPSGGGDPVVLNSGPDSATSQVLDDIATDREFAFVVRVTNRAADAADVQAIELTDPTPGLATDGVAPFEGTPNPLGIGIAMTVTPELLAGVEARQRDAFIGSHTMPGWTDGGWLVFILRTPADGCYQASGVRVRYRVGEASYETDLPASLGVRTATLPPDEVCPFQ